MKNTINNVNKNIRLVRKKSRIKPISVAKYLGISLKMLYKIERGEEPVTSDVLEKIAVLFNLRAEDFSKDSIPLTRVSLAFHARELTANELEAIAAINKIGLNTGEMSEMLMH